MRCVAVFLALLLVPAALAQGELPAQAEEVRVRGQVGAGMDLLALAAAGDLERVTMTGLGGYVHFEDRGVEASGPAVGSHGYSPPPEKERYPAQGDALLDISVVASGPAARVHVIPSEAEVRYQGRLVAVEAEESMCITQYGIGPRPEESGVDVGVGAAETCDGVDEEVGVFSPVGIGDGLLFNDTAGGALTVQGEVIVELRDMDLRDGSRFLPGRYEHSTAPAGTYVGHFYRFTLSNATITIEKDGAPDLQWAAQEADLDIARGHVAMEGGQGELLLGGDTVDVGLEPLTGDMQLFLRQDEDMVGIDASEPAKLHAADVAPVDGGPWGLAALASILPVLGVALLVRRARQDASMQDIERALERGRYGRADRLSRRILRDDPLNESARLSRAIALTKSGRAQAAVENIQELLDRHQPADGTLHYVMGLALLDLKRDDEARQAIDAAVRLTPALADRLDAYFDGEAVAYA